VIFRRTGWSKFLLEFQDGMVYHAHLSSKKQAASQAGLFLSGPGPEKYVTSANLLSRRKENHDGPELHR
jgi:hypothetical protein